MATEWTRIPKGTLHGAERIGYDYGGISIAGDTPSGSIGTAFACGYESGWTASATLHGVACESQAEAEALAEKLGAALQVLRVQLLHEQRMLRLAATAATLAERDCAGSSTP